MKIEVRGVVPEEMVVLLPKVFLGSSEAGEPLPAQVVSLINARASKGYWPFDFGEDHGTHVELWFAPAVSVENATRQAEHFIKKGGYV